MRKFKKILNSKIVIAGLGILFSLDNMLYPCPISKDTVRVPVVSQDKKFADKFEEVSDSKTRDGVMQALIKEYKKRKEHLIGDMSIVNENISDRLGTYYDDSGVLLVLAKNSSEKREWEERLRRLDDEFGHYSSRGINFVYDDITWEFTQLLNSHGFDFDKGYYRDSINKVFNSPFAIKAFIKILETAHNNTTDTLEVFQNISANANTNAEVEIEGFYINKLSFIWNVDLTLRDKILHTLRTFPGDKLVGLCYFFIEFAKLAPDARENMLIKISDYKKKRERALTWRLMHLYPKHTIGIRVYRGLRTIVYDGSDKKLIGTDPTDFALAKNTAMRFSSETGQIIVVNIPIEAIVLYSGSLFVSDTMVVKEGIYKCEIIESKHKVITVAQKSNRKNLWNQSAISIRELRRVVSKIFHLLECL
ncbi:MAG: hypothetical protein KKD11_00135 [Candidatus Omnitrophica bacterium]|nr:hypothetical protein [Candidatus Omnitrophota bacterium]